MEPTLHPHPGAVFNGSLDNDDDLVACAAIAVRCAGYSRDDDDECYVEGYGPTCFNCRGRRWLSVGFGCMKGYLGS